MDDNRTSATVTAGYGRKKFDANFRNKKPSSTIPCPATPKGYICVNCYCTLEDLKDKVLAKAMDQQGWQFLHQKLHKRKPEDVEAIFSEVKYHVCLLMYDRFGSHVIQKLFLACNGKQMRDLVFGVTGDAHLFKATCLHSHGSHSMRKFLECLRTSEQICHVILCLKEITVLLVKDEIGARVIQHCFNIFSEEETEPIFDVIVDNCCQIASNRSGSRLLQVLLSKGIVTFTQTRLVSQITVDLFDLSINRFGNYVVQHLIGLGPPSVAAALVDALRRNFDQLSMDKYASHVVERLMEASEGKYLYQIIDEIVSSPDISRVILSRCGSRVVQSARKYSKGTVRKTLNRLLLLHS